MIILFRCFFLKVQLIGFLLFLFTNISAEQIIIDRVMLHFPSPTVSDINAGYIDIQNTLHQSDLKIDCRVNTNQTWELYLVARQPYFTPFELEKPIHHLLWKHSNNSIHQYKQINPYKTLVAVGKGPETLYVDFRLKTNWNDIPAFYRVELDLIMETQDIKIIDKKTNPILKGNNFH